MNTNNTKELIDQYDYNLKSVGCSQSALIRMIFGGIATAFAVPFILTKLPLATTFEIRVAAGMFTAVPGAYFVGKYSRKQCMKRIEDKYTYSR